MAIQKDHIEHLAIHTRANETKAKKAHIEAHKAALKVIKENPNVVPEDTQSIPTGQQTDLQAKGSLPKVNYDQTKLTSA